MFCGLRGLRWGALPAIASLQLATPRVSFAADEPEPPNAPQPRRSGRNRENALHVAPVDSVATGSLQFRDNARAQPGAAQANPHPASRLSDLFKSVVWAEATACCSPQAAGTTLDELAAARREHRPDFLGALLLTRAGLDRNLPPQANDLKLAQVCTGLLLRRIVYQA